jgi:hypothetical protein
MTYGFRLSSCERAKTVGVALLAGPGRVGECGVGLIGHRWPAGPAHARLGACCACAKRARPARALGAKVVFSFKLFPLSYSFNFLPYKLSSLLFCVKTCVATT